MKGPFRLEEQSANKPRKGTVMTRVDAHLQLNGIEEEVKETDENYEEDA